MLWCTSQKTRKNIRTILFCFPRSGRKRRVLAKNGQFPNVEGISPNRVESEGCLRKTGFRQNVADTALGVLQSVQPRKFPCELRFFTDPCGWVSMRVRTEAGAPDCRPFRAGGLSRYCGPGACAPGYELPPLRGGRRGVQPSPEGATVIIRGRQPPNRTEPNRIQPRRGDRVERRLHEEDPMTEPSNNRKPAPSRATACMS